MIRLLMIFIFFLSPFFAKAEINTKNLLVFDENGTLIDAETFGIWTISASDKEVEYIDEKGNVVKAPISYSSSYYIMTNRLDGSYYGGKSVQVFPVSIYLLSSIKIGVLEDLYPGKYGRTVKVTLSSSPSDSDIEVFTSGHWVRVGKTYSFYVVSQKEVRVRLYGRPDTERVLKYQVDQPPYVDTDHDGLPDVWEVENGFDPLTPDRWRDTDGDGWNDFDEIVRGSDPNLPSSIPLDTDGDGWSDFDEEIRGTDPKDPKSHPVCSRLYEVEEVFSGYVKGFEGRRYRIFGMPGRSYGEGVVASDGSIKDVRTGAGCIRVAVVGDQGRVIFPRDDLDVSNLSFVFNDPSEWLNMLKEFWKKNLVVYRSFPAPNSKDTEALERLSMVFSEDLRSMPLSSYSFERFRADFGSIRDYLSLARKGIDIFHGGFREPLEGGEILERSLQSLGITSSLKKSGDFGFLEINGMYIPVVVSRGIPSHDSGIRKLSLPLGDSYLLSDGSGSVLVTPSFPDPEGLVALSRDISSLISSQDIPQGAADGEVDFESGGFNVLRWDGIKHSFNFNFSAHSSRDVFISGFSLYGDSILVMFNDGSSQILTPRLFTQRSFLNSLENIGIEYSVDRGSGIVSIGDTCWLPDPTMYPLEDAAHIDLQSLGFSYRFLDANGDGVKDIELTFPQGSQVIYGVSCR